MKWIGLALIVLLVPALLGCGGPSEEQKAKDQLWEAEQQWENEEGPDWAEYLKSYLAGWRLGCDAVAEKDIAEHRNDENYFKKTESDTDGCDPLEPDVDLTFRGNTRIPDDPQEDGYDDGRYQGCMFAYDALSRKATIRSCRTVFVP